MTLRSVTLAAAISIATLAIGSESDIKVISQYVISHKRWPAKVFRIERKDCDCAYALYRVIYLPEDGKLPAANSKSFALHYDEQRHRIVKETQYQ
ncbi:MAG TPA: hypothetical protein VIU85_08625 [Chthoniobacterales bacterium]